MDSLTHGAVRASLIKRMKVTSTHVSVNAVGAVTEAVSELSAVFSPRLFPRGERGLKPATTPSEASISFTAPTVWLSLQQRDAVYLRWCRYGRQVRIDVGDFLIRHHFCRVRRHLFAWLPQLLLESSIRDRLRGEARAIASLTQRVMALKASLFQEQLFAVVRIPGRRRCRLGRVL